MRKKIKKAAAVSAVGLLLMSMVLTGCSKVKEKVSEGGEAGKGENTYEEPVVNLEDKKICNIGDTVIKVSPTNEDPDNITLEYIVKGVKLYDTPEAAGIERDTMLKGCQTYQLVEEKEGNQEIDKNKVLMSEVNIKNINADSDDLLINSLMLVYINPETKKVEWIWDPVYFSNPKNTDTDSKEYLYYKLLKGENMDVKVAWLVDPSTIDIKNLYLAVNYLGEDELEKFIQLFPNE